MTSYYILTKKNSDRIVKFGNVETICNEWAKIKYTISPDEEWSVKEVKMEIGKELTKEQIEDIVEKEYEKWNPGD